MAGFVLNVSEDEGQMRVDRFLRERLGITQSLVCKLIRKGAIKIGDKDVKAPSDLLESGDEVSCPAVEVKTRDDLKNEIPQKYIDYIKSRVVHITKDLLVIDKPRGFSAQSGSKVRTHECIDNYLPHLKFGNFEQPRLVHRIDKETTGILIIARNRKTAQILTKLFQQQKVTKEYVAVLSKTPMQLKGVIDLPLLKNEAFQKMIIAPDGSDPRNSLPAVTHYNAIKTLAGGQCLVKAYPYTGRKHQIRVHFAAIGCPIVGDTKYNPEYFKSAAPLLLHAHRIQLNHENLSLDITIPPPPSFQNA